MKLLARVFRVDISVCSRCCGPMRVTRAVTTPEHIAANLRGARPLPRASPLGQLLLFAVLDSARSPLSLALRARRFRTALLSACLDAALRAAAVPCRHPLPPDNASMLRLSPVQLRSTPDCCSPAFLPSAPAVSPYSSIPDFSHFISPKRPGEGVSGRKSRGADGDDAGVQDPRAQADAVGSAAAAGSNGQPVRVAQGRHSGMLSTRSV